MKITLNIFSIFALILSFLLFAAAAAYLGYFLCQSVYKDNEQLDLGEVDDNKIKALKVTLGVRASRYGLVFNSCGMFVGVAFAFLGLSLFLLGAKGNIDAQAQTEKWSFSLARLSPGALAIICGTAIVIASLTVRPSVKIDDLDLHYKKGPILEKMVDGDSIAFSGMTARSSLTDEMWGVQL